VVEFCPLSGIGFGVLSIVRFAAAAVTAENSPNKKRLLGSQLKPVCANNAIGDGCIDTMAQSIEQPS
jgi:hypothetical protein